MMGCIMTAFLFFFFFLIASLMLEAPMRTHALSPDGEYISHHTHDCNNCVKHTISAIELYPCFSVILMSLNGILQSLLLIEMVF
jgi:hypothetical protein